MTNTTALLTGTGTRSYRDRLLRRPNNEVNDFLTSTEFISYEGSTVNPAAMTLKGPEAYGD